MTSQRGHEIKEIGELPILLPTEVLPRFYELALVPG